MTNEDSPRSGETQIDPTTVDHEAVEREYRARSADDLVLFVQGLTIPSASGPKLFCECIAPFQLECFQALAPSLTAVRDGLPPPVRRFWIERTKKSGKDSDLALVILWLMAFAKRPILCQVCAADQDQAAIVKRRVEDVLHYNPWLDELVSVKTNKIVGSSGMGTTVIEATDASGGAHGETPDLLVLNELVHVKRWHVMETHMNNADGVPRGMVIVSTNAGYKGSKAEKWRQEAMGNPARWKVMLWSLVSPWSDPADVREAEKRNIKSEYERLWKGRWVSGSGDAATEDDIDRAFRPYLEQVDKPEPGWLYLAAFDLGISHDHAAVALVGVNTSEGIVRVCRIRGWAPNMVTTEGNKEVDLDDVERVCLWLDKTFRPLWFGYDPAAGGSLLAQRLGRRGLLMRKMSFASGTNQTAMAMAYMQLMKGGRLHAYEDPEGRLRRDFGKFDVLTRPGGGYKLVAVSDEHGHADVGVAVVICLPQAMALLEGRRGWTVDDVLADEGESKPLSADELEGLPPELREIYGAYDDLENEAPIGRRREGRK